MQNKTGIIVLTVIISLICLYNLSFTYVSRNVQSKATEIATKDGTVNHLKRQAYLDSVWKVPVYNFFGLTEYTYQQVKEKELNLGLDLQGGMNVTLEISPGDILAGLAGNI